MNTPTTPDDWSLLIFEVGRLFSGAPIAEEELFAGRSPQVLQMLEAVIDPARHIILYGERGVGKTSIANVFWKRYNQRLQTVVAARVQADPSDSFSSLWIKALEELKTTSNQIGRGDLVPISTEYDQVSPDIIRRELQRCRPNAIPILIIDEFDKLRDRSARELTANVIKALHDYTVNVTIILVGVADDVGELLTDHQSLRRALSQVRLERMPRSELNEILDKRLSLVPLNLETSVKSSIVTLSRGLPYYVQMLGKHSSQNAAYNKRLNINIGDFNTAMDKFIQESGQSFGDDYRKATESNQPENLFEEVLLACALADVDENGFFTPTNVVDTLNLMLLEKYRQHAHIQRHLSEFISDKRGSILIRRGVPRQYRYRFADPMMQPHVIIAGIRDGAINDNLRRKMAI